MLHQCLPVAGQKHNRYCGPAALAAITGINTGQAAALLRWVGNRRSITGAGDEDMLAALYIHGFELDRTESHYPQKLMTLRKWLDNHYTGQLVLVSAGRHWWAIEGDKCVDSFNRRPTPIEQIHMPRCQVCDAHYLTA